MSTRARLSAALIVLLLGGLSAAVQASAPNCTLGAVQPVAVGDTARWSLDCTQAVDLSFAWSIQVGQADPVDPVEYTGSIVRHLFPMPGRFAVTVRISGPDGPASIGFFQPVIFPTTNPRPSRSAVIAFDSSRQRVWVTNPDNGTVTALFKEDSGPDWRVFREVEVGKGPANLCLDGYGQVWVSVKESAELAVLDAGAGDVLRRVALPYGSRPHGLACSPTGDFVYVALEGVGEVVRIRRSSGVLEGRLPVFPAPRALAVSHDGARILVTRFISPKGRGEVAELDGPLFALRRIYALAPDPGPDGPASSRGIPTGLRSVVIAPDGRSAYVVGDKANVLRGLSRDGKALTFETTVRSFLTRLDLLAGEEDLSARRDIDNRSALSDVALDSRGILLYAAASATQNITMLAPPQLENLGSISEPEGAQPGFAPFPDGIAMDGKDSLLFVRRFLARELAVYDISAFSDSGTAPRVALVRTIAKEALSEQVLLGKRIFNDASNTRMGRDGYISCGSCHAEGGSDGRVWDFTDRGEGLRRTTTLLGKAGMGHGPVHWSANFDEIQDFEHDIRGPFQGEGFLSAAQFAHGTRNLTLGDPKAGLSTDLDALAAYVSSLDRVRPSPHRNPDGSMTAEALRGKQIFQRQDVGCAVCHQGPNYTDSRFPTPAEKSQAASERLKAYAAIPGRADASRSHVTAEGFVLHDVGTLKPTSGQRLGAELPGLDTPTLLGVWEGGLYLHDGAAENLMDVLVAQNPKDLHGKTSHLTEAERKDLVAFLLQLDGAGEGPASLAGYRRGLREQGRKLGPHPVRYRGHRVDGRLFLKPR